MVSVLLSASVKRFDVSRMRDFLNTDRNTTKKYFRIEIWTFSFQICFQSPCLTSGSGQTENTQICIFAYFQFDHFPKLKIDFESRLEMRMSIFLSKKIFGGFW